MYINIIKRNTPGADIGENKGPTLVASIIIIIIFC
jgi:hypothetical protein